MIGKRVAGNIYLHKDYESELPQDLLRKAKELLSGFEYTIIRLNIKTRGLSFIQSPDWDVANEPIVGDSIAVSSNGSITKRRMGGKPQVYHHKWMFVGADYKGFSIAGAKQRSALYSFIDRDMLPKIGYKHIWLKWLKTNKLST